MDPIYWILEKKLYRIDFMLAIHSPKRLILIRFLSGIMQAPCAKGFCNPCSIK